MYELNVVINSSILIKLRWKKYTRILHQMILKKNTCPIPVEKFTFCEILWWRHTSVEHPLCRNCSHDLTVTWSSWKNQMMKVMFNFQYHKGIINLELKIFGMNLLSTFCTLWKVLLLWMNSYVYYLNHIYTAAWWGFTW